MCDYEESSQAREWLFTTRELDDCRQRANQLARVYITKHHYSAAAAASISDSVHTRATQRPVHDFARGYHQTKQEQSNNDMNDDTTTTTTDTIDFLEPSEEVTLIDFYAGRLPSLIGPHAQLSRLQRKAQVTATAILLYRRFYLANSTMLHDPKTIMVAAAFLAAKVQDSTADIRYLEEGTKAMNAPVSQNDVLSGELALLQGVGFDLQCFHPYKAVLAFTHDLRVLSKTKAGRGLVQLVVNDNDNNEPGRPVVGQDLTELHDGARKLVEDFVVLSDLPLLYSPGQLGLACMMVANQQTTTGQQQHVKVDFNGYLQHRFATAKQDKGNDKNNQAKLEEIKTKLPIICSIIKDLVQANKFANPDMVALKAVHKKLKKCRAWGTTDNKKKKKKKKRKAESSTDDGVSGDGDEQQGDAKRAKTTKA